MMANLKYSGHHDLPRAHVRLRHWYARMSQLKSAATPRGVRIRRK
jgi:hypothetical protein